MTTHTVSTRRLRRTLAAGLIGALVATVGFAGTTSADGEGQPPIRTELGVGFFYGTFDESPYLQMLVGGTADEFCADNPTDPFNAEPSSAPGRIYFRSDGSVDVRIDSRSEEVNIYTSDTPDGPAWITQVCAGEIEPVLFASGSGRLKMRVNDAGSVVDVFNSVRGEVTDTEGTRYRVSASADLIVENGVPVGNPADFVSLELSEIGS